MFHTVFKDNFSPDMFKIDEPMKNHSSFKTGGPASVLFLPKRIKDITDAIKICKVEKINYLILGNGSNVLFCDEGFCGVVIKISKSMAAIEQQSENVVTAQAGVTLSALSNFCVEKSLKGMEFASGIPGTLGGAVFMNAGAYYSEMKEIVQSVQVLDNDLEIRTLQAEECDFSYRNSKMQRENWVVLSADIVLEQGKGDLIREKMNRLNKLRAEKQPLNMPSAGSTFKRPPNSFAGKLIEESGLRGYAIGGAQVSEKHCGFIVNKGNATSKDILDLIKYVQQTVASKFDITLEPEIKIIASKSGLC